jgi:fermentation-respiration switch protein FrsA (DUF1100 family)
MSVGANLYLFKSPTESSRQCVIIAHSGRKATDVSTLIPARTSISFYAADGGSYRGNTASGVALGREGINPLQTIGPRGVSWDYRVEKFHDVQRAATYRNVQDEMTKNVDDWKPHVVTIRNRKLGERRTMRLSNVIAEVQAAYPHITEFHLAGCRQTRSGAGAVPPQPGQQPGAAPADAGIRA